MTAFWRPLLSLYLCFHFFTKTTSEDALLCNVPKDSKDFCQCDIQGLEGNAAFDLRPLFASGALQTQLEGFLYTLSPCSSVVCSNHTEDIAVCQESLVDQNLTFSLGTVSSVEYDLSGSDPSSNQWLVVGTYFMGDTTMGITRIAQVRYAFNSSATAPTFILTVDDPTQLNYFFAVESDMVLPNFPSSSPRTVPAVGWVLIGLGSVVVLGFAVTATVVCIFVQVRRRGYVRLASTIEDGSAPRSPVVLSGEKTLQWSLLEGDSSKSASNSNYLDDQPS